jgi:hypothetical protein
MGQNLAVFKGYPDETAASRHDGVCEQVARSASCVAVCLGLWRLHWAGLRDRGELQRDSRPSRPNLRHPLRDHLYQCNHQCRRLGTTEATPSGPEQADQSRRCSSGYRPPNLATTAAEPRRCERARRVAVAQVRDCLGQAENDPNASGKPVGPNTYDEDTGSYPPIIGCDWMKRRRVTKWVTTNTASGGRLQCQPLVDRVLCPGNRAAMWATVGVVAKLARSTRPPPCALCAVSANDTSPCLSRCCQHPGYG